MKVWALHGFLGLPSDFDLIQSQCQKLIPELKWQSIDYLRTRELSSTNSLSHWGAQFNRWIRSQNPADDAQFFVGYSQGGRLALHALKDDPDLWAGGVILSANPGILNWQKPARAKADQEWAERFLNENFDRAVSQWNAQSVFQGSLAEPVRKESDYNRQQLANCLLQWSVAQQENFTSFLSQVSKPLLYLAGESDSKYCQIGRDLNRQNSQIQFCEIQKSGHRVIFDQPQTVSQEIVDYFEKSGRGIG